jgi:hypothetical protein
MRLIVKFPAELSPELSICACYCRSVLPAVEELTHG